jgi:hypothetical protein
MSRPDFGPFEPAFALGELPVPRYLCLLNLRAPSETLVVIDRIRVGLDDPRRDAALHALLGQIDWRPHLVAAVALLLVEDPRPFLADLWSAVRAGSWVSPQLLAVAAVRDPNFLTMAAARETEGFVVRPPIGLTPAERHSATGPASVPRRSAKELSALVALCDATSQGAAWAAHVRAEPELQRLIAADVDRGGDIATRWLASVRQILHPKSDPK